MRSPLPGMTVVSKSSTVTFRDGFAQISADGGPSHRNKAPLFVRVFWCSLLVPTDLDVKLIIT